MEVVKTAPVAVPAIKYRHLNDQNFINALKGLVNFKTDNFKVSYKLTKILDKVDAESSVAQKLWADAALKLEWEDVEGGGKKPKDPVKYKETEASFLDVDCDFSNCRRVNIHELLGYQLSAVEMKALEPILDGLDELALED